MRRPLRRRWARGRPDLHRSLRAWPGFALYETGRLVRTATEAALADAGGLTWNGMIVLVVLDAYRTPLSHSALRIQTGMDRTTLGRTLLDLEYEGYVETSQHFADGRQLLSALTRVGEEVLEEARAALEAGERDALIQLEARERRRLHQLAVRALPSPKTSFFRPA